MTFRGPLLLLALALAAAASGCGQKGPLFLPGDPSQVNPAPTAGQESDADEEDEDDEPPR